MGNSSSGIGLSALAEAVAPAGYAAAILELQVNPERDMRRQHLLGTYAVGRGQSLSEYFYRRMSVPGSASNSGRKSLLRLHQYDWLWQSYN
jgi:hypothetical protein